MISLQDGRITDILPLNLSKELEVQAFAYALHRQVVKLCDMADRTRIFAAIQTAPDEILDYLAVELRTPCYDMTYSTEVKRSLILSTLPYYMKMGTTAMVNSILTTIFGSGRVIEFFEAYLDPHYFMLLVQGAEPTSRPSSEIRDVLEQVKRKSQWLAGLLLEFDPMEHITRFGGCFSTNMTTPLQEQPDEYNFEQTERVGGTVGSAMTTPLGEQEDRFDFLHTENIGGSLGTTSITPLKETADEYRFLQEERVGGGMGTTASSPVPMQEDNMEFRETVQAGGGMNTLQRTPVPEQ